MNEIINELATPEVVESDAEQKARRLGWVPKEEFRGDPERWRPAEEFLDRGERILPLVQADNRKLHKRVDELETVLRETREASKELLDYTRASEQRAYDRARREIQVKIETAAANADQAAVRAEMANLDALEKPRAEPKKEDKPATPSVDPQIQDWISQETWFNRDGVLKAYAIDQYGALERDKPGVSVGDLLAETKRRTMQKFPEKFGIDRQGSSANSAAAVASPTGVSVRRNTKTYENLPADARAACDKFIKTIPGYKKEDYLADYDWEA